MSKTMNTKMKLTAAGAVALVLSACGGGGGGGSDSNTPPTSSNTVSACSVSTLPQGRLLDLDKAGYVVWYNLKVSCTDSAGATVSIAGLPASAFKFTGNGVTGSAPEDMVVGKSSVDGSTVYLVQAYRKFSSAAAVQTGAETLAVSGADSLGRTITASTTVSPVGGPTYGVDDLTQGITLAASRTIDSDNQGYTATTFVVAYAAQNSSSSAACPVGTGVKDYPTTTVNSFGQTRDMRYCMYTGLTAGSFYYTGAGASWRWLYGADQNTQPTTLAVNTASVSDPSLSALRTPVYKVVSTVRFPKAPTPNFASVEANAPFSRPGWIYFDTALSTNTIATTDGAAWY